MVDEYVSIIRWNSYENAVITCMGIGLYIRIKVEGDVAGKIAFFTCCRSVNRLTYSVNQLTYRVNRLTRKKYVMWAEL